MQKKIEKGLSTRLEKRMMENIINAKINDKNYSFQLLDKDGAKCISYLRGNRGQEEFQPKSQRKIYEIIDYVCQNKAVPPILVNRNTNTVMEGNHRLYAYRVMWEYGREDARIPVVFCSSENELEEAREINTKQDNWQSWQFLKADAINGDENAKKIIEFCEKNPICLGRDKNPSTRIAYALLNGKDGSHEVCKGTYNVTDQQFADAKVTIDEIQQIYSKKKVNKVSEKFIIAWCKLKRQNELNTLLNNWGLFLKNHKILECVPSANLKENLEYIRTAVSKFGPILESQLI